MQRIIVERLAVSTLWPRLRRNGKCHLSFIAVADEQDAPGHVCMPSVVEVLYSPLEVNEHITRRTVVLSSINQPRQRYWNEVGWAGHSSRSAMPLAACLCDGMQWSRIGSIVPLAMRQWVVNPICCHMIHELSCSIIIDFMACSQTSSTCCCGGSLWQAVKCVVIIEACWWTQGCTFYPIA